MATPNLSGALRGWTKKTPVLLVTKTVVNSKVIQTATEVTLDMNLQPLEAEKVNRKPEEQRAWKWFSLLTRKLSTTLNIDNVVIIKGIRYRVESVQNWEDAGFRRYECVEDYQDFGPLYFIAYDGNESTSGNAPRVKTYYEEGVDIPVLWNTGSYAKTGYVFTGWNTEDDGYGTAYDDADEITMTESVTLYAQWEALP
jgi:uncharacterized repeat protein (TIGR02543 family)